MREVEAGDAPRFLDRLRAGETAAFEELVITYQHRVFGVAVRMLGNAAEAQEVAQEAFLRAHRGLAEFRGDAKLSTWLYAITSRLCLNRLARTRGPVLSLDDERDLAKDSEGEGLRDPGIARHLRQEHEHRGPVAPFRSRPPGRGVAPAAQCRGGLDARGAQDPARGTRAEA